MGIQWSYVTLVRIQFRSAKNIQQRSVRAIWFSANNDLEGEDRPVVDLP
jgi:hypothetical protein